MTHSTAANFRVKVRPSGNASRQKTSRNAYQVTLGSTLQMPVRTQRAVRLGTAGNCALASGVKELSATEVSWKCQMVNPRLMATPHRGGERESLSSVGIPVSR